MAPAWMTNQTSTSSPARPGTADEEALRFLSAWAASCKESTTVESDWPS
jgi:hypothetical protein